MNEMICRQLKTIVERVVRPTTGSRRRKRLMREELLAHLTGVFEEEQTRLGDDSAALEATRSRFGSPDALVEELEKNFPRWDRMATLMDQLSWQPDESLPHLAVKHALATVAAYSLLFLATLPVAIYQGKREVWGFTLIIFGVLTPLMSIFSFVFVFFPTRLAGYLYSDPRRRAWRKAIPDLLISLLIFPTFAFFPYFALTGDLAANLRHARFACCFAPVAPLLFSLMGRVMFKELQYEREWASLEIDD